MQGTCAAVWRGAPGYPARLADLREGGPERLFVRGTLPARERSVAIVGARAATGRGMDIAESLGRDLAERGVVVVSGGALGIDAAAHRGALTAGGATVAVLACGLDAPYPARNRPLFDRIAGCGGAIVTTYEPGTPPRRWQFVRRNRVVAAWVDAVVIVEASPASGSLYTAHAALELGRVLGAVPGTPGCESLIAEGAAVIETADDVFAAIDGTPRRPDRVLPELGSERAMVLAALERGAGRSEDELSLTTGLQARAVSRALAGLELEGLAVLLPGRSYVRSSLAEQLLAE